MSRSAKFGRIYRRSWKKPDGSVVELSTWWIEYYRNGKQKRESSHSDKYADAQTLLRIRQADIVNSKTSQTGSQKIRVSRLLDRLLDDYRVNQKSVKWAGYVDGHLRPFFGEMIARSVGTEDFTRYIQNRRATGIKNATINRELALLRRSFQLALDADPPLIERVPRFPKLAENNVRKGFFEYSQFERLRAALPQFLKPVITFAFYTGCRKGEILSLRWDQVDLTSRAVRLEPGETKNGEARTIPLAESVFRLLVAQKTERDSLHPSCPFVFSRHGKPLKSFYGAWAVACKRAGLHVQNGGSHPLFHDLRRTGVRNLVRAGVPEPVAMKISGHKTRSVFDRYNIVDERDITLAGHQVEKYLTSQSRPDKAKSSTSGPEKGSLDLPADAPKGPGNVLN